MVLHSALLSVIEGELRGRQRFKAKEKEWIEDVFSDRLILFEAGFLASGWDPGICYVADYVFVHRLLLISFISTVLMRSEGSKFRVLPCGAAHEGYKVFCLPFDAEVCLIQSLPTLV